jgi:hypothetical protein
MVLAAVLSGIPLVATWASVQWAPVWAHQLSNEASDSKALTQLWSASGALIGGLVGAAMSVGMGVRKAYALLCVASYLSVWVFYQTNHAFDSRFLISVFFMGGATAAFYGWLPSYLPRLFPTKVRAIGAGFGFNFGRIIAAIGALQTGVIMGFFDQSYSQACTIMATVYFLGLVVIWWAPAPSPDDLPE